MAIFQPNYDPFPTNKLRIAIIYHKERHQTTAQSLKYKYTSASGEVHLTKKFKTKKKQWSSCSLTIIIVIVIITIVADECNKENNNKSTPRQVLRKSSSLSTMKTKCTKNNNKKRKNRINVYVYWLWPNDFTVIGMLWVS